MTNDVYDIDRYPWLGTVRKNPITNLMRAAPLPIRYELLRDILEDQESEVFQALQQNLRKHQPRRKLLNEQTDQGLWPIEGKFKGLGDTQIEALQFIRQLEVINDLLNMMVTHRQEKAILGMREVIRYLAEKTTTLRMHHLSQAIYLTIVFKLDTNPIIKQLVRDILQQQKSDGGWSSLPEDKDSCIWSTLYFLWTMGHSEPFKNNRTLKKGFKYVEANLLTGDHSHLLTGMQPWDTLISGTGGLSILGGGTLRYLETAQLLAGDTRNRKAEKMVDWLVENQLKTGLWPSIIGRDKQGDYGVTLRVMKVLKHFQSRRLKETIDYDLED